MIHTSLDSTEVLKETPKINETLVLFILASIQFTHIMDFVIMMPMNPIFQEVFQINNRAFGWLVSAYAASAGVSGFITFFFIDRLDRKRALLLLYTGFALGTVGCAVAGNYYFFLAARIVSGAFGGILGALVLAVIGDVFPESRRGRATGIVMASFSLASIIGIPSGLYLASKLDWHAPFYIIAGLSVIVIFIAWKGFPEIKGHINKNRVPKLEMLREIFRNKNVIRTLLFTCSLMLSGFCITPYLSDFFVSNIGFDNEDVRYTYLIGGCASVITGPLVGRIADRFGKRQVFVVMAVISFIPILAITSLPPVPKVIAYAVSTSFFIFFGGRFVPAMSMLTSSIERSKRGGLMSIANSFQQIASALAATIGGFIIGEKVDTHITNFWMVGIFSSIMTLLCIYLSFKVKQVD